MNHSNVYTILIDVDDVINNCCEEWCNYLNRRYGCSVHFSEVTEWEMSKFFPELTNEQIFEPLYLLEFWRKLKPKDKAGKYIKQLMDEGHKVYLCTTSNYQSVRPKFELFINRWFPYIKWSQIIITSNKQMIEADFLVDDGVHNLDGGKYNKILMTAPHNKNYDAKGNGMHRADDWDDVYKIIQEGMNDIDR